MPNLDSQTVQLIIVAGTALALLLQTIFLLAILLVVRKSFRGLREEIEDLRSALMPIIYNTRDLMTRLTPKIEETVEDLSAMTRDLRVQTSDVQSAAKELVQRVRHQAIRVDEMMSTVLNAVDRASGFVTQSVSKPVRQFSALLASAKAIIESLRHSEPPPHHPDDHPRGDHPLGDKDMFV